MHLSVLLTFFLLPAYQLLSVSATTFRINVTEPDPGLEKRAFDNAEFSFTDFNTITACGKYYLSSDFVVALNSDQFGTGYPGPNCYRRISITANGKSTNAQIVDKCVSCDFPGLDLSPALFQYFAHLSVGRITGSWDFI